MRPVIAVKERRVQCTVYNLNVAPPSTYAVGLNGVLVHNKPRRNIPDRPTSPRKLTDWEVKEKLGEHPHELKQHGSKSDIYVDKDTGWIYEGKKDGTSWESLDMKHPDWD